MKNIYLIINDEIEGPKDIPDFNIVKNANGEIYYIDDYGMGAIHWPIISDPSEAYDRQMRENVLWAQERLEWASKNNPKEVYELIRIIESKGKTRHPDYYNKLKI